MTGSGEHVLPSNTYGAQAGSTVAGESPSWGIAPERAPRALLGDRGALRFVDWIWHVRGTLALSPEQSNDETFALFDPLFRQAGTSHEWSNDTLVFTKKDQAAQDKMSIFDGGVFRIERSAVGRVLRYNLTSRALLFCFLAPLLFLGIAQFTSAMFKANPQTEASGKSAKASDAGKKDAVKKPDIPMNPVDKFLGAPAPEKPGKKGDEKTGGRNKKPTPTPAYVLSVIFAALYVIGRILEAVLFKRLLRRVLLIN